MRRNERPPDQDFAPGERLYRRVHPDDLVRGVVAVDAIALPDVSTMRERFTHDLQWVLIDAEGDRGDRDFSGWGIVAFTVADVPETLEYQGTKRFFSFSVVHAPEKYNYPHSEVRAFDGLTRIREKGVLPKDVHLRFRERLRQRIKVVHQPASPC